MSSFADPAILVPILIFGIGFLCYYVLKKNKRRKYQANEQGDKILEDEPVLCRVADNLTGHISLRTIPFQDIMTVLEIHHTLGRQRDWEGKKVYGLCKHKDGQYEPILPPTEITQSATELYEDMQFPEVEILYDMREEKTFSQKYGQLLWWIAVIGFIIFMMISNNK